MLLRGTLPPFPTPVVEMHVIDIITLIRVLDCGHGIATIQDKNENK